MAAERKISRDRVVNARLAASRSKSRSGAKGGALPSNLGEVEVKITLEWGRTEIALEEALELAKNSMLPLDEVAGEAVKVVINGKLFGRGKVVMVGDYYGVQLTELAG